MRDRIALLTLLSVFIMTSGAAQEKFKVDATFYNNSSAEINDVEIVNASRTTEFRQILENITLIGYDSNRNRIFSGKIPLSFVSNIRTENGGIMTENRVINKQLYVSYNQNITRFEIYDDRTLDVYNITDNLCVLDGRCLPYCQENNKVDPDCSCGDNICQSYENAEICAQDCSSQAEIDSPDTAFEGKWKFIFIALALISVGIILLLRQYIEKENNQESEGLEEENGGKYEDIDLDRYNHDMEE